MSIGAYEKEFIFENVGFLFVRESCHLNEFYYYSFPSSKWNERGTSEWQMSFSCSNEANVCVVNQGTKLTHELLNCTPQNFPLVQMPEFRPMVNVLPGWNWELLQNSAICSKSSRKVWGLLSGVPNDWKIELNERISYTTQEQDGRN